jgi:hypothetical protein
MYSQASVNGAFYIIILGKKLWLICETKCENKL